MSLGGATIDGVNVPALVPSLAEPADEIVPAAVLERLAQARASLHAPLGALVLVRQAVEQMFPRTGDADGPLLVRLRQMADRGVIPLTLVQ